jgi:hypothetical protein
MIRFGHPRDAETIAQSIGVHYNPRYDVVISNVTQEGNVLGGVLYTLYTKTSIHMHVSGFKPRWMTRDLLWVSFHYPFVKLSCSKVLIPVSSGNSKCLAFADNLGFKEEARISDVYQDGDLVMLSMRRDECRWLSLKPRTLRE